MYHQLRQILGHLLVCVHVFVSLALKVFICTVQLINSTPFCLFQALREKAKQNAAKKIAPHQKVIESYGFH